MLFAPSGQASDLDVIRFESVTRGAKVCCMWAKKMLSRQVSKTMPSRLAETDKLKSTVTRTNSRIESPAKAVKLRALAHGGGATRIVRFARVGANWSAASTRIDAG